MSYCVVARGVARLSLAAKGGLRSRITVEHGRLDYLPPGSGKAADTTIVDILNAVTPSRQDDIALLDHTTSA